MTSILWYLGRGLQLLGLVTTGFALFVGLSTSDSRQEIGLLGLGAAEFLIGLFILKRSSSGT